MKKTIVTMLAVVALLCGTSGWAKDKKNVKKADVEKVSCKEKKVPAMPTVVMYDQMLSDQNTPCDLILPEGKAEYGTGGLSIKEGGIVKLNRYYSLADRKVRYVVKFAEDDVALFQSDCKDGAVYVDVKRKTIGIKMGIKKEAYIGFMNPEHEYMFEVSRYYNTLKASIADLYTGEDVSVTAVNDGPGGAGIGVVNRGLGVGLQHDYYCFGLESGKEMTVRQVTVLAGQCDYTLLLYGDSITEPETYFPADLLDQSWIKLIMNNVKGKSAASGRGGKRIQEVLERIKNELPYVKAKYVMVTIGTNGGNTEENLTQLVEYILSQNSIPILNNIPSNEHNSQVAVNEVIEKVRKKFNIKGVRFDLPTSLGKDGKEVDKSTMWTEDIGNNVFFYHHPNLRGAKLMYLQSLRDTPEIYE